MVRRLRLVVLVGLAGAGVWWLLQRRNASPPTAPAPVPAPGSATGPAPASATGPAPFVAVEPEPVRWVPPVDGECPSGFPVKANANSGIFHLPGGRFYARTVPERCYATAEDAEADGYRRAKA
jgi:hypothetical protein